MKIGRLVIGLTSALLNTASLGQICNGGECIGLFVFEGTVSVGETKGCMASQVYGMGTAFSIPNDPPSFLCAQAGSGRICSTRAVREQGCVALEQDTPYSSSELMARMEPSGLFAWIRGLVEATRATPSGGKRLNEAEQVTDLPREPILKPAVELVIPMAGATYRDFELFSAGAAEPLYRVSEVAGTLVIPTAYLENGATYDWKIVRDGSPVAGTFSVALLEDQQAFEEELQAMPGFAELPQEAQGVVAALLAEEWQFTFDSAQFVRPLLSQQ